MGTIQHHAIVATTFCEKRAGKVVTECASRGYGVVHTVSDVNGYHTLYLPTDGSKEGWSDSDLGDNRRNGFVDILNAAGYFDWVEVSYGELGQSLTRGSSSEADELGSDMRTANPVAHYLDPPTRLLNTTSEP